MLRKRYSCISENENDFSVSLDGSFLEGQNGQRREPQSPEGMMMSFLSLFEGRQCYIYLIRQGSHYDMYILSMFPRIVHFTIK